MEAKILITGGSGFIGTNLIRYYINRGITCVNFDLKSPRDGRLLAFWKECDLLDIKTLREKVHSFAPTHVLHLAARTDIDENNNIEGYSANFEGTENLIKVIGESKSVKRVIFTSSMLVCKVGYQPKSYEDYCPPNLYGESKVLMEKLIRSSNIKNYEWLIIRPTSIWGPWFQAPYRDFFDLMLKRKYFKLGSRSSTKTFGFVLNSVYQIDKLLFMNSDAVNTNTFYIGDSPALNINEWADLIGKQLGFNVRSIPFPLIKVASLLGDVLQAFKIPFPLYSFRVKNMTTDNVINLLDDTKSLVPEQPYSTEEGITLTLNWLKEHGK